MSLVRESLEQKVSSLETIKLHVCTGKSKEWSYKRFTECTQPASQEVYVLLCRAAELNHSSREDWRGGRLAGSCQIRQPAAGRRVSNKEKYNRSCYWENIASHKRHSEFHQVTLKENRKPHCWINKHIPDDHQLSWIVSFPSCLKVF